MLTLSYFSYRLLSEMPVIVSSYFTDTSLGPSKWEANRKDAFGPSKVDYMAVLGATAHASTSICSISTSIAQFVNKYFIFHL